SCRPEPNITHKRRYIYLEALLQGGAPWGFTLKGGLEHGEPLIISKIKEGGKADLLSNELQPGDEVVNINEVNLTSSRQKAIALVKSSCKTLKLVVRRDTFAAKGQTDLAESHSFSPECLNPDSRYSKTAWSGGVKLRLKNRRSDPVGRPHSWHPAKFIENQPDLSMMQISQGMIGNPWHQAYHSSSSTSDLSSYDHGFLRRSPDQYSSRGSMESLDHATAGFSHHPCHLSPAKSTNSIDQLAHLHSKRDSAYSSFSTNSSTPEYPVPAFGKERSYSVENVHSRGRSQEGGMRQADIRYIKTVYNAQRGVSEEYEVNSSALLPRTEAQAKGYRSSRSHGSSKGPPTRSSSDGESQYMKGPPMPPARSDSYAAIRHHERPSSWSSLDGWPHLGPGTPSPGPFQKPAFLEGQLHTVVEKSPESSPVMKPKQVYSQAAQPGQPLLPTGVYPVPSPEPHFAQVPPASASHSGTLYPALAKESGYVPPPASAPASYESAAARRQPSGLDENGNHSVPGKAAIFYQPEYVSPAAGKKKEVGEIAATFALYRTHPLGYPTSPTLEELEPPPVAAPTVQEGARNAQHSNHSAQPWQPHLRDGRDSRAHHPTKEYGSGEQLDSKGAHLQKGEVDSTTTLNQWSSSSKAEHGFSSLQNIPESTRLQNSSDWKEAQLCKRYSGANWHFISYSSQEEKDCEGPFAEHGQDAEWQGLEAHQDTAANAEHSHGVEPKYEELSSPQPPKTSDFSVRRLSSSSSQSFQNGPYGKMESRKARCSVLEKVNKIEQREQGSQWPQSLNANSFAQNYGFKRLGRNSIEDIQNRPISQERGQLPTVTAQQGLYCGGPFENGAQLQAEQLQRSRSTFQVLEEPEKGVFWKGTAQDLNGSQLDIPFNRAYRNRIKDAQSRVLRATSFRRKDLNFSPPFGKEPKRSAQRPASAHLGMRSPAVSPHTPKERHRNLPGALHIPRIGGRKRLTAEQKKRSYSEPEKMNEVGVSDGDLSPFSRQKKLPQFVFPENTVADRRKIFERENKACSTINLSKPELKQLQQNALADYIERKTGKRPSSASHDTSLLREGPPTPYLQVGGQDGQALSSASSMNSLQDQSFNLRRESLEHIPRAGRGFASLPPGLTGFFDLGGFESKKAPCHDTQAPEKKPALIRKPGKSASAEDLLERSENQAVAVHVRSRSSPIADKKCQVCIEYRISLFISLRPVHCCLLHYLDKERGQTGTSAFTQYHPHPRPSGEGVGSSSVLSESQKALDRLRHISRTSASVSPSADAKGHHPDSKRTGRPHTSPRSGWSNAANATPASLHFLGTAEGLLTKWQPKPDQEGTGQPHVLEGDDSLPKELTEEASWRWKSAVPQRCLPPKIKWVKDAGLPKSCTPPQTSGQKVFQQWPNLPSQSSSSSETGTASGPGRFSLRISESCLQESPPLTRREEEDDDDDVFFSEPLPRSVGSSSECSPPPLPPPPAPSPGTTASTTEGSPAPPAAAPEAGKPAADQPARPGGESFVIRYRGLNGTASSSEAQPPPLATLGPAAETPASQPKGPVIASRDSENAGCSPEGHTGKTKTPEEMKEEALAKEIIHKDKSLASILDPDAKMKTTMDLMEGIFPRGSWILKESWKRKILQKGTGGSVPEDNKSEDHDKEAVATLVSCPAYCMSVPQPELLNKAKDSPREADGDEEQVGINAKKAELIESLSRKLETLQEAKQNLLADIKLNNALGEEVEALISGLCKPNEFEKYKMFIGDLDKVVSLLLSLSGRLARVENVLSSLGEDTNNQEWSSLNEKRKMLAGQHEDACELKENLDRRERVVLNILCNYLPEEKLQEYQHFVKMKSTLLIEQRELDDKIKLGQEQLKCLVEGLPTDFTLQSKTATEPPAPSSGTGSNSRPPAPSSLL
uniref:Shroom family member 3 n=1 Tax=Varanus komodoensis TaxID=61221 RepID=A0A8D2KY59_VARKO